MTQTPTRSFRTVALASACSVFWITAIVADVKPNALFTDGAVLQRGQVVPVWGTADEGENVTVEFEKQKVTTTTKDGKWRVDLKPLEAGGPFTMKISGKNTLEIKNLLAGEVWVCSGQSNMETKLSRSDPKKEEQAKANFPRIRMFTVNRATARTPQTEHVGSWSECIPENAGSFSAVGYFFAKDLHQKLGAPVGMVHASWGGTAAQAWTSIEGFAGHPELKPFAVKAKAAGRKTPNEPVKHGHPTALYNGMIAPIVPYAMKGVIWYQGETNRFDPKQYRILFPALITNWRNKWKQGDFPFLYVQVAPFKEMPPEIREAQFVTLSKSKNTAMAVTTDVGDANDIHPIRKQPVGHRLALAARAMAYGEEIEYSGPLYASMKVSGDAIKLSFQHVGGGLVAKDGDLKGFTIAGADGKFVPAKAVIQGDQVIVSANDVKSPKAARYGWANVPDVNLYNKEGLPASPFRTDVE